MSCATQIAGLVRKLQSRKLAMFIS
uniref:Uncharacterized protein n=1 Tax=Arundo donax TaxID=35708 RepID=A0A0A8YZM8_ARUDO